MADLDFGWGEQLALLREQTRRTGILHEAQKIQLDYWIRIVLDSAVVSHVLKIQLETPRMIVYEVKTAKVKPLKKSKKATAKDVEMQHKKLVVLDQAIKQLLGSDVAVKVRVDGKMLGEFGPEKVAL